MSTAPNVLLIICDDLRPDALGCCGQRAKPSPVIDALAKDGICFTDAHCPAPLCNPARTAVFTGMHPVNSGVYNNNHWWRPALGSIETMPEGFRRAGYQTAGFGKIFHHTAGFQPPEIWDHFDPIQFEDPWDRGNAQNYPDVQATAEPDWFPANGLDFRKHEFDWGHPPFDREAFSDSRTAQQTAQAIRTADTNKPFFITAGFFRPHIPLYSPAPDAASAAKDLYFPVDRGAPIGTCPQGRRLASARQPECDAIAKAKAWPQVHHHYLQCVRFVDQLVGELLQALEDSGQADNTIVVFTADHGYHLGDQGHFGKQTLWPAATRVPLIIKTPKGPLAQEQVCKHSVGTLDIMATLYDLCQIHLPPDLQTRSLLPAIAGQQSFRPVRVSMSTGDHAVVHNGRHLIRYADGSMEYLRRHLGGSWSATAPQLADDLLQYLPASAVAPVPGKSDYDFDHQQWTWQLRQPSPSLSKAGPRP